MHYYTIERSGSLAHYGRLGMKWYQHIYGQYQGTAKYAAKGEKKLSKMKERNKEAFPKIANKAMKLSRKQYKYATKAAKFYRVGRDEDAQNMEYKAAKYEEAANKLQNQKMKAILRTAKLNDKVKYVKDTLNSMSKDNSTESKADYKKYEEALSKDGWKRNDKYAFGDSTNFEKKIKVGKEEVLIEASCDRKEDPAAFKERITSASNAIVKNNDSIKASIAKEAYKELQDMGGSTRGVTKDQFQKGLTMSLVSIGRMLNEVSYDDTTGLYGDHFFTAEVDDKGKYYRYSMNG